MKSSARNVPLGTGAGNADCCVIAPAAACCCGSGGGAVVRLRTIFVGFGAGGAAAALPSSAGAASGSAAAAGRRPACPGLRAPSTSRSSSRRRRCGGGLRVLLVDLLLTRALVEILRHALLEAGHAVGEYRLALARQLLLGVEEVEQIGRIETGRCRHRRSRPARPRARRGRSAAIRRCDRRMVDSHSIVCAVSSWRPAAARPAALRRASAGSAASRRHWRSCRATAASPAASLARQADSASNSRALWRKVAPGAVAARAAAACWDRLRVSSSNCAARIRARSCSARRPAIGGDVVEHLGRRLRIARRRLRRRCATAPACDSRTAPSPRDRRRPPPPRHACSDRTSSTALSNAAPASAAFLASRYW